jgi:hypothetical protein
LGDMANGCEPLQRRDIRQAKGAGKPEPKGKWAGAGASTSSAADVVPPAYGWSLSHSKGTYVQRSKPVSLPWGKRAVR